MEMETQGALRKRVRFSYSDDSEADEAPRSKRARFPKGKKDTQDEVVGRALGAIDGEEEVLLGTDPRVAALERATRRDRAAEQLLAEDTSVPNDVAEAEEEYEDDDEERVEDGMRIEPFNLKQEREEGYFDAKGNYVEYRNDNELRDAWLDSVEVDTRFAGKTLPQSDEGSDTDAGLSKEEIGGTKRRIADALQPGETVLRALRRLKGTAKRMPVATKIVFDQLTEDAMKLMDNGDYNVYEEEKEVFQREAEGYEALARLRSGGANDAASSAGQSRISTVAGQSEIFPDLMDPGGLSNNGAAGGAGLDVGARIDSGAEIDIFGEDDRHT